MPTPRLRIVTRRSFVRHAATAGLSLPLIAPRLVRAKSPNSKLNIGGVGVGGKGFGDTVSIDHFGHNVAALCDVDMGKGKRGGIGEAAERWPDAARYQDWRVMLDKHKLDAINVSTPDHMHAPITMSAMRRGIHVYCQKPLTHTVHEARAVAAAAREFAVKTQMGNQHHSSIGYRMLVEYVRGGALGKVTEAHAWTNRPGWAQGMDKLPAAGDAVPKPLDWDKWLGVAPARPYAANVYHPSRWRGWFDFGTGALGDMGCHIIDPVVWALDLPLPSSIESIGDEPSTELSPPSSSVIRYRFPATAHTAGPVTMTWYDGGKLPPREMVKLDADLNLPQQGTLIVCERGQILTSHGGGPLLLPRETYRELPRPQVAPVKHYASWTDAIINGGEANSNFQTAAHLTEIVLLGQIAVRFPKRELKWDGPAMKFTDTPDADRFVRREYRGGWEVQGL